VYVINTTYGWNLGDDLIREGVINLLRLQWESKVFANRGQLNVGSRVLPVWKLMSNVLSADKLGPQIKGIGVAGTPEWIRFFEDFYEAAIRYNIPIYLVGIGMDASKAEMKLLDKARGQIRGVTVRDKFAACTMALLGIPYEWFPDPAFAASYTLPKSKRYTTVVGYMAGFDVMWRYIANQYKTIDLVTVHDMHEYEDAKRIFKAPVFYSSDYMDYKEIYASTVRYIGGRIHGAFPVVACGGTAHLFYARKKVNCAVRVAELIDTLTVSDYVPIPHVKPTSATASLKTLAEWNDKHMDYWAERV